MDTVYEVFVQGDGKEQSVGLFCGPEDVVLEWVTLARGREPIRMMPRPVKCVDQDLLDELQRARKASADAEAHLLELVEGV